MSTELQEWIEAAVLALDAAIVIGMRSCNSGDGLNYGNHDRLIGTAPLEAARKYANPDIDAAVASVFTKGGAGRPGQEWPVEMYPSDIARAVRAAALGITEDTNAD